MNENTIPQPVEKRKICLFTGHSPLIGGGSVIIRSLVENLPELAVTWYYTESKPVAGYEETYLGPRLVGGPLVSDIRQTWNMLNRRKLTVISNLVEKLLAVDCDAYWIVSHNEGLRIAMELSLAQQDRPVHLTVHDDWPGALCARSTRYRFMHGAAKKLTVETLKMVTSFDVISEGMLDLYEKWSGRTGGVCHRYIPADALRQGDAEGVSPRSQLRAGHIGTVYDKNDFIRFLTMFRDFAHTIGKEARLSLWGCHLTHADLPETLREIVEFNPTLSEGQIVEALAGCAFVYAMYPMAAALRIFSKTSLPTKLSSYVLAGRPIFGYGPGDSTLAGFLDRTHTGVFWNPQDTRSGSDALNALISLNAGPEKWEQARRHYFGENNLAVMTRMLNP